MVVRRPRQRSWLRLTDESHRCHSIAPAVRVVSRRTAWSRTYRCGAALQLAAEASLHAVTTTRAGRDLAVAHRRRLGGWQAGLANFVVVANRLPVDRDFNPDGTTTWRTSPGGLVSALEPVMQRKGGAWIGWHGAADERLEPFEHDGIRLVPVRLSTRRSIEYYEGFSNGTLWPLYHDVVAPPQFHREWWDSYVTVNQRFAKAAARVAKRKAHGLGAGLPAPAGAGDAARAAAGPAHRLLPAHPVPADRAVPAAAVAPADPRGPHRRRPGRLPAARRRARTSSGWSGTGSATRPRASTIFLPDGRTVDRPGLPDLDRRQGASRSWRAAPEVEARAKEIRASLGQPEDRPARHRPARLHQGPAPAAPRLRRADPRRLDPGRRRRVRPGGHAVARTRRAVPASCATTSTGWSAASTATSAASARSRSPTCTRRSRARRWPRSTERPTSWSSPRCATA